MISVDGCTWFGKPRSKQSNQWLVDEIEYISEIRYKESGWDEASQWYR